MPEQAPPPLPGAVSAAPRISPIAIVSVVLAVLSFLCVPIVAVIPAIICGHVAWSKIRKSGGALQGKGIALTALILGYLAIPWAVLQIWFLAGMIQGERGRLHDLAIKRQELVSEDSKLKITTSGFWVKRTDLNPQAALQAANKAEEMYVMVIGDAKSTVPDMTLQQHHQLTRDHMMQKMTNASTTVPISTTIDGHPALQDQVNGTTQGANLIFLHTTVDEGD